MILFNLIARILYGPDWERYLRKPARVRVRRRR